MWKYLSESTTVTTSKYENADRLSKSSGTLHPGSDYISHMDSNEYKEEMPYRRKNTDTKTNSTQDEDMKRNEASGNTMKTSPYNRVDLREKDHGDYRMVPLNSDPPIKICIHSNVKVDKQVSGFIARGQLWEGSIVKYMQRALAKEPSLGFLDIGSNIGEFALVSAKMNHSVVAVEALALHANMLRRSAQINSLEDKIILINNAVSNTRRTVQMKPMPGNMGGTYVTEIRPMSDNTNTSNDTFRAIAQSILLDDLVDIIPFKRAIMKIDIEAHEPYAIAGAERLFREIDIPLIIFEFGLLRKKRSKNDVNTIQVMFNFFRSRDYDPYTMYQRKLSYESWRSWPWEIIFKRADYKF